MRRFTPAFVSLVIPDNTLYKPSKPIQFSNLSQRRLLQDGGSDEDVDVLFRGAGAFSPKHASEEWDFTHDGYIVFPLDGFG